MNLLITSPANIRYLSGFTGSKTIILQTPKHNYFITDARYFDEAKRTIPRNFTLEKYIKNEFEEFWKKALRKHQIKELYFEADHLTYSALKKWKKISRPAKLIPQTGKIEKLRAVKKSQEISLITRSQRINEQVFYSIIKLLKPGVKEAEIAWKIHQTTELSFDPIIAFGKNSAIPHHKSDQTRLKKGDIILIDMGIKYHGYCSDMTRTLFTKTPTPLQAKIYETVLKAQEKTIAKIKPGMTGHKAWTLGTGANQIHGIGHGIGLDIHESPSLAENSKDKLQEGTVVTIEPGIYLEGKFGVRIEDLGVITKYGFKNLTKTNKRITVIN